MRNDSIVRFEDVSFEFGAKKPILHGVNFAVRRGAKVTLMGQNGAGKSTIFKLITGELKPEEGDIHKAHGLTIATARQVILRSELQLTVRAFFEACFSEKVYDIYPRIDTVLEAVNLEADKDRIIDSFSGGQQARLLLASALIQNPDLLLLDEPTNNLDAEGIEHLRKFLVEYRKSCIVISHDADFLNAFTDTVLYLDVYTHIVEQYDGNYKDVVQEIGARVAKEQRKNAQYEKEIKANKEKANYFANKGGQMRLVAKRMREKAADMEESKIDVRKEDRSIRKFTIPIQDGLSGEVVRLSSVSILKGGKPTTKKCTISLTKNRHLLIKGPNGIGKTTLLDKIAHRVLEGMEVDKNVRIGYYGQDFSNLDFDQTVFDSLMSVMEKKYEQDMRSVAAGFLLGADLMHVPVGMLSEGQKGLLSFARFVLQKPGLLILDEPTNHMNFRHLPTIAKALDQYQGPMILVSHVSSFVEQIRIDDVLDLEK